MNLKTLALWLIALPLLAILALSKAHAGSISIAGGSTYALSDSSCATVKASVQSSLSPNGWFAVGCTEDPVVVGSRIGLINPSTVALASWTVSAISAPMATAVVNYQPQIDVLASRVSALEAAVSAMQGTVATINSAVSALQSLVASLQTQVTALQNGGTPGGSGGTSAPYDYQSGGLIFAAVLLATLSLYFLTRAAMEFVVVARKARHL